MSATEAGREGELHAARESATAALERMRSFNRLLADALLSRSLGDINIAELKRLTKQSNAARKALSSALRELARVEGSK